MGGRGFGTVNCGPGCHEGRAGAFPRTGGQRPVHLPHPDPDVPVAAAQGMQGDLHDLVGPFHDTLDLVADRALKAPRGGERAEFLQEAGDPVDVPGTAALVDRHDVHDPSLES